MRLCALRDARRRLRVATRYAWRRCVERAHAVRGAARGRCGSGEPRGDATSHSGGHWRRNGTCIDPISLRTRSHHRWRLASSSERGGRHHRGYSQQHRRRELSGLVQVRQLGPNRAGGLLGWCSHRLRAPRDVPGRGRRRAEHSGWHRWTLHRWRAALGRASAHHDARNLSVRRWWEQVRC